jgi:hypothetical protein
MIKDLVIKDRTYSFGMLPAVEALKVEVAIAKVIGEPLFKALTEKGDNAEAVGGTIIGLIASRMNADELLTTMETVFNYVSCNGERIEINSTFTGRNKELWSVFLGALRYNFSDFLDVLPSGLNLGGKTASPSSNQPISTGT